MDWIYWSFLSFHVLCCAFVFVGILFGFLRVRPYMLALTVLLPFWGILIVLVLHCRLGHAGEGTLDISVERMKLQHEMYKSLTIDDKKSHKTTVPLEEALVVNAAAERRSLIMDVLNDNPKEYISFLQKAGDNDDTEVVHYAVTAMVEISKENDYMMQQLEQRYTADPTNFQALEQYAEFLWECLEQKLMQGQVEIVNRQLYSELVRKKLAVSESLTDYVRLINNEMKLKNYASVAAALEAMAVRFAKTEEYVMAKLQYLIACNDAEKVKALLAYVDKSGIYFSARSKEILAFWKK